MIYRIDYETPAGASFPVDIEAPDEAAARLAWAHRHPERFGYRLKAVAVAPAGAEPHLRWEDYANEYDERFFSPVVKTVEMGLVILSIAAYAVFIGGGVAVGYWLGLRLDMAYPMPLAVAGLGIGILMGYASNVILDWMRSMVVLQHEIIERLARDEAGAGERRGG